MSLLDGTYYQKIDAKGRTLLPSALKKQLTGVIDDGFILKHSINARCLDLVPKGEWEALKMDFKENLSSPSSINKSLLRKFMSGCREASLDASGRLLIPADLQEWAVIHNEIVIIAMLDTIEIWSKQLYEIEQTQTIPDQESILNRIRNKNHDPKE